MSGDDQPKSYLAECYWPGVSEQRLAAAHSRIRRATDELRKRGHELEFIGSILVPVDETVFCLFDGTEERVRRVGEQARIPFERILESLRIAAG
jgi:hypothetical protein